YQLAENDGTPYDGKLSRTVLGGGKGGDDIKALPITHIEVNGQNCSQGLRKIRINWKCGL
ncbi:hypothetical protein ACS2CR_26340, partial [Bacillus cereus group sp. BceL291]|uniref:hypothetical protein n=1 Tax=Bacillus cereus group sp. BceL291 TaxID=3444993 RepID=UPI003F217EE9